MAKTKALKNIKDNQKFTIETRSRSAIWTVITKRKGMVTINSDGGSTRIVPGTKQVYPL